MRKTHLLPCVFACVLLFLLPACAGRISKSLAFPGIGTVSSIGRAGGVAGGGSGAGFEVWVEELRDGRDEEYVVATKKGEVPATNDPTIVVTKALKSNFKGKGFIVDDNAPVVVGGIVQKWVANVTSGFPSKVETEARLFLEVLDPTNRKLYSGVYTGYAFIERPGIDDKAVSESLSTAMTEAIAQAFNDRQFVSFVSSF